MLENVNPNQNTDLRRFSEEKPANVVVNTEPGVVKLSQDIRDQQTAVLIRFCGFSCRRRAKEESGDNFPEVGGVELRLRCFQAGRIGR